MLTPSQASATIGLTAPSSSGTPSSSSGGAFQQAPGSSQPATGGPLVHIPSPAFDYVPPHLISLFVTDMGGYTPSYVYRLLAEFYDRNDYALSKQIVMG